MARGWEIPFFQLHWDRAGMEPGDIRSLEDLVKVPPYDVHDIRASIERNPPYGDFMGMSPEDGKRFPMVLQTSGGTTGLPRPMLYSPIDRETMAILGGRRFALHGIRPGDMVLVAYALGLSNGAMAPRESLWRYTGAVPVMTGGGATTPTRRQIELIKAWKINVVLSFPTYLRHMALVARDELGIDVRTLGIRTIGTHIGMEDRAKLEAMWNAPCHDMYGTHESGMMAAECVHRTGMHVQEDAFVLEIADPETGRILPDGELLERENPHLPVAVALDRVMVDSRPSGWRRLFARRRATAPRPPLIVGVIRDPFEMLVSLLKFFPLPLLLC
jgi:phenylacetate-CoA ligase